MVLTACGAREVINGHVATLKFAECTRRFGGRGGRPLNQRQTLYRLEFSFDIPENASLGLPVAERVTERDELPREEVSHTFIGDQITK